MNFNSDLSPIGKPYLILLQPCHLKPNWDSQTIERAPLIGKIVNKPDSPLEVKARIVLDSGQNPNIECFVNFKSTADEEEKYKLGNYGNIQVKIEGDPIHDFNLNAFVVPENGIRLPSKLIVKNAKTNQIVNQVNFKNVKPNNQEDQISVGNGNINTDTNYFGKHIFELNAPGFTSNVQKFINYNGVTYDFAEKVVFLSPQDGDQRVVLSWDKDPQDLDLHICDSRGNHVYYSQKSKDNILLDVDVTSGFGPETISFKILPNISYWFYVHHYSGDGNLSSSQAKITVYGIEGLNQILVPNGFSVNYEVKKMFWDVFKIVALPDGRYSVEVINTIVHDSTDFNQVRKF